MEKEIQTDRYNMFVVGSFLDKTIQKKMKVHYFVQRLKF